MKTAIINNIIRFFSLFWLTGPVFDKELRVSSRKRRNFVLRFTYISLMLMILLFFWVNLVDHRGTDIFQISRMAQAGKYIITCIVAFQFIAAQIIAIVIMSNSISDEIYNKTLGMLMTTPITGLQIVMGKLLSKLLQLLLLIAISMPLLSITRLLGGVPWKYVTSSLCITFTTVLFVSSLSLFYSIFFRRTYRVIIVTILTLFGCFLLIPFIVGTIIGLTKIYEHIDERVLIFIIYQPSPYLTFLLNTMTMLEPQNTVGFFYSSVYINSVFMTILSFFLLLISIIKVRKVALRQATGQLISSRQRKSLEPESEILTNKKKSFCFSVTGPPVLWKELILPLRKNIRVSRIIGLILMMVILFYTYWYNHKQETLDIPATHYIYITIFLLLSVFFTLVNSPTNITSEKESRSWPLLLSSTLSDNQILFGKFTGVFTRCLPVWGLLLGHLLYLSIIGMIHPAGLIMILITITWIILFLCSTGIYFSSCYKHTTTAVIINFVMAVCIWGVIALFLGIVTGITESPYLLEGYMSYSPFALIIAIMNGTIGDNISRASTTLKFDWIDKDLNFSEMLFIVLKSFVVYMTFALLFLWRAKKRIRRKIF